MELLKAYIPAELTVLRCTLDGGVEGVLQAFLDPGPLPTGYMDHVMLHDGLDRP